MSQENKNYRYEKYIGREQEVILPAISDGKSLSIIGSKAFLSCKTVERLYLPETLEMVEDWGFAHMKNLREITMPVKKISFGRQVFLGCDRLQKIHLLEVADMQDHGTDTSNRTGGVQVYKGIPIFLASMFRFFPEEQLENLALAGEPEGQWKWLASYDAALLIYVKRPNDYGFEPAFIGWFDIEDVDEQKEKYMVEQRKNKIRLAFQRLRYNEGLQEEDAQYLKVFLLQESDLIEELFLEQKGASKGGITQEDTPGQDITDYKIWQQSGGLNRHRAETLLQKLSEEEPEIRGYLLNIQLETTEAEDFFEELEL